MPLTKRQFELQIDEEMENWMRQVYLLLVAHRELAYSYLELLEAVFGPQKSAGAKNAKFRRTLDILCELGAIDRRSVGETDYYAIYHEVNTRTWQLKVSV